MPIERMQSGPRMSQIVVNAGTVYLAGQVAMDAPGGSVTDQTKNIVDRIDPLLAEARSDKSKILSATIWLSSIKHYDEMNAVWDAWIDPGNPRARACVEAILAFPEYDVEIMVLAAQ